MTAQLPPNLVKLFIPRPPLPYVPPSNKKPKQSVKYTGVAEYVSLLKNYDADYVPWQSIAEKRQKKAEARRKETEERIKVEMASWDPKKNQMATQDPYKTLLVARLSYETTERHLRREFEYYGPVRAVRIIYNLITGQSRGYAFVEFEREQDMKSAYKDGDRIRIDGRRVLVDVERGRTVKGWRPRRFGGGLGNTRAPRPPGSHPNGSQNESTAAHDTDRRPFGGRGRMNERTYDRDRRGGGWPGGRRRDFAGNRGSTGGGYGGGRRDYGGSGDYHQHTGRDYGGQRDHGHRGGYGVRDSDGGGGFRRGGGYGGGGYGGTMKYPRPFTEARDRSPSRGEPRGGYHYIKHERDY